MSLFDNQDYVGEIKLGVWMRSRNKGTPGFQLSIAIDESDHTTDDHTIWLTEKTKESAEKTFLDVLGVKPEQLKDVVYMEKELPDAIVGMRVLCTVKADEYNGKTKLKIAWINPVPAGQLPLDPAAALPVDLAVSLFGGKPPVREPLPAPVMDPDGGSVPAGWEDDDGVPF